MSSFLETLRSGRVLLMDGAMGTEVQRAGIGENECYEAWNLTHPEKVRAIHQAYVDAGAEVLLTNTFQANIPALSKHGLADKLDEIIGAGIGIARSVAENDRLVIATFGPISGAGDPSSSQYTELIQRVWKSWLSGVRNPDAWLFETSSETVNFTLPERCPYSGQRMHLGPLLFSWTYERRSDGTVQTIKRSSPLTCALRTRTYIIGVNCGRDIGMDEIIQIIRRYREVTDMPLFARPNAGTPTRVGDRWVYPLTPEKMAERLPELLEAGVSMVGGCCGTTPEHIAAMRPIVDAWNAKRGFKS